MSNQSKQHILDEICRTAKENGGKPLGKSRFEKETGIKPHEWGKFWARFGDAQKEAGFLPNQLQTSYADGLLIEKFIGLMRELGKFPTFSEIKVKSFQDGEFPSKTAFTDRWKMGQLAGETVEFCKGKNGYDDILGLCQGFLNKTANKEGPDTLDSRTEAGEVYLMKSGRFYKIGMTKDTFRRGNELRTQLPERVDLIHSFKTDDPSGLEAYWHKRFKGKRKQGEWFDLNSTDVKAFKRWKKIY